MKPLLVARVRRFTPGDESAEVTLRSEQAELVAFSHPCEAEEGSSVVNRLYVLDGSIQAAYLIDWPEDVRRDRGAERLERTGTFSYRGVGRVVDQEEGLVEVLGFVFDFGEVPCDGYAEFECMRLDL